jgi:hypothetical protein
MPRFNGNALIPLRNRIERLFREQPEARLTAFDVAERVRAVSPRDVRECLATLVAMDYLDQQAMYSTGHYVGTFYRLRTGEGQTDDGS